MQGDFLENAIEWVTGSEDVYVTFTQMRFRNKIRKLAEIDAKVQLISDEDATYAKIPLSYIKVQVPRKVNISDERREEMRESFRSRVLGLGK